MPDPTWIRPEREGIHLPDAGLWIDPATPKPRAVITHGHADHARSGHGEVIATPETLAIMEARYGPQKGRPLEYGELFQANGLSLSLHPAGHVLGSSQVRLEGPDATIVVSGDYKRRPDPTCAPFEPIPCDVFVTEATFALPVFRHPDDRGEIQRALAALAAQPDRCLLVGAYALGKAQRVIALMRELGHGETIYLHGALMRLTELYQRLGVDLGDVRPATGISKEELKGKVVMCPPSALNDRWTRRLPEPITAFASGWMRIRNRAKQKGVEQPIILSDHADWDELTSTIRQIAPREVWVTHGRDDALVHWCGLHQIRAKALHLVGREDEDD